MSRKAKKYDTPIADFLASNAGELQANFHALPIFHLKPGMPGYKQYRALYGSKYLANETTISGDIFDSFFYPVRAFKKAQNYAANVFTARDTLFVTCGTSISNQIVVDALVNENSRVLLDRETHQSLHFAVSSKKVKFDYFYSEEFCNLTERKYIKMDELIKKVTEAKNNQTPYDVIIVNAASYDGVIINVYELIKRVHEISPETAFMIDEAWSSAFYFHPKLYKFTAGYAAKKLKNRVNIVSTQSAHKSLMALRQASFIHSFANAEITEKLYRSRFKYHSTSPNYAILASMDLARAHMQTYGKELMSTALACAKKLRDALKKEDLLIPYLCNENTFSLSELSDDICFEDPLKIHINLKNLHISGAELQDYLYHNYGIYFNRFTENTALINIHIGISEKHVKSLIQALKLIKTMKKAKQISAIDTKDFIISYPPGIPLYSPGEKLDNNVHLSIQDKLKNGITVFQLN